MTVLVVGTSSDQARPLLAQAHQKQVKRHRQTVGGSMAQGPAAWMTVTYRIAMTQDFVYVKHEHLGVSHSEISCPLNH